MNSSMIFVFSAVCLFFSVCVLGEDVQCETNYFFNRRKGECQHCSECIGNNQIIRFPCSEEQDTICGPFVEFDKFHQSPIDNLNPLKNITYDFEDKTRTEEGHYPTNIDSDKKWYTLAMALLGVLSFISLFVGIYIVVVCFVCKKRRRQKEIIYNPEPNSTTAPNPTTRLVEPTVYIQSRDRLKRGTPRTVYTMDDEYDADNSNQTISSTSSHYVYFKTADAAPPN